MTHSKKKNPGDNSPIKAYFVKGVRGSDPILNDSKPKISFIGRSNVGKSSLINSILRKKDLVKIGKKPGKTTEINFFIVDDRFYFVDLPGYGFAKASLTEREKLRKLIIWYFTESGARNMKAVLIIDAKAGVTKYDIEMHQILKENEIDTIVVVNKIDKLSQSEVSQNLRKISRELGEENLFSYSSKTKAGYDELFSALVGKK